MAGVLGFTRVDIRPVLNFLSITIRDRYLGSRLGRVWAVLNPLLILGVYVLIFGYVFKARLPGSDTTLAYAIWLIAGFGSWTSCNEALMGASNSVVGQVGLIKNVAFKTEMLPLVAVLSSIVTLGVTLVFLFVLLLIDGNLPSWHIVFVLPVIACQYLFLFAVGLFLSVLTVFYRDTTHVLTNILNVILFLSPIIIPYQLLPKPLQAAAHFIPFYHLAEGFRAALVFHKVPDLGALGILAAVSFLLAHLGLLLFRRAKGQFEAYL
jgi:lipopolysaccharide transport system permease protein